MRRIVGFLVALGLIVAGLYWTFDILLYAQRVYAKVLLAPVFMITVGCIWLYSDSIDAIPNERR